MKQKGKKDLYKAKKGRALRKAILESDTRYKSLGEIKMVLSQDISAGEWQKHAGIPSSFSNNLIIRHHRSSSQPELRKLNNELLHKSIGFNSLKQTIKGFDIITGHEIANEFLVDKKSIHEYKDCTALYKEIVSASEFKNEGFSDAAIVMSNIFKQANQLTIDFNYSFKEIKQSCFIDCFEEFLQDTETKNDDVVFFEIEKSLIQFRNYLHEKIQKLHKEIKTLFRKIALFFRTRNIRNYYRHIIQFLFKNMDDESDSRLIEVYSHSINQLKINKNKWTQQILLSNL